jgi:hypothetical protein
VLGIGAVAVLMYTGRVDWPFGGRIATQGQACTPGKPLTPKQMTLRVYNGSSRSGLARQVTANLKAMGFVVTDTGNDPLEARLRTAVEIRYGEGNELAAKTVSAYFAGRIRETTDERVDPVVDVVLGPTFKRVHTRREVNRVLEKLKPTFPLSCPPGVTPPPSPSPTVTPTPKPRTSRTPSVTTTRS